MDYTQLNSLPEKVKSGEISMQEAVNKLWEIIYKNPRTFGLATLDEDQLSEFLIYVFPRFKNILKKFKDGPVNFFFYVYSSLHHFLFCWLKKYLKRVASDISAAEATEVETFVDETRAISPLQNSYWENQLEITKISESKKILIKNFIHVLACKACNEIDEEMIKRIADFLEMDENKLKNEINELKKISNKKIECRRKLIERRNKAYFFHKKYQYEMEHLQPDTNTFLVIKEKYEKQTECWEKDNQLLRRRYIPTPTAEEIAFSTGLKPRTVWFYLNHAKSRKEFFPFLN